MAKTWSSSGNGWKYRGETDDSTGYENSRKVLLKEFQEECIEKEIVINLWYPRIGDYFQEIQYGGYKSSNFEYEGITYLSIDADVDSLTPKEDGFTEIKGSEFYKALEAAEEG